MRLAGRGAAASHAGQDAGSGEQGELPDGHGGWQVERPGDGPALVAAQSETDRAGLAGKHRRRPRRPSRSRHHPANRHANLHSCKPQREHRQHVPGISGRLRGWPRRPIVTLPSGLARRALPEQDAL
jgi:hypothetical protein